MKPGSPQAIGPHSAAQAAETDAHFMALALAEAHAAAAAGEVPVGAVVVRDGQVLGRGRNAPIATHDPTAHAEIQALREAAQALGNYRLDGCTLYATLEPCAMCSGAILHARIGRLVYGAPDPRAGAAGSVLDLFAQARLNHHATVTDGVLAQDCGAVLQTFFQSRRQVRRAEALAAHPLREDALRTPDSRFAGLGAEGLYLSDLPAWDGLRLHVLSSPGTAGSLLCLHRPGAWSEGWRRWMAAWTQAGLRVIAPDLAGHGRSDKPKREAAHTPERHLQALAELLERLAAPHPLLVVEGEPPRGWQALAPRGLLQMDPALVSGGLPPEALQAPFPDKGHAAGPRALARAWHGPGMARDEARAAQLPYLQARAADTAPEAAWALRCVEYFFH